MPIVVNADHLDTLAGLVDPVGQSPIAGIVVEPSPEGGALLVATDGYVMGIVNDREGIADRTAIIRPVETLRRACRRDDLPGGTAHPRRWIVVKEPYVLVAAARTAKDAQEVAERMADTAGGALLAVLAGCLIDGPIFDWRKVLDHAAAKEREPYAFATLDARFLAKLAGRVEGRVNLTVVGNNEPVRVTIDGLPDFFGLIMPIVNVEPPQAPVATALPEKEPAPC